MNWTFLTITIWHSIWPLLSATGVLRADIPRTAFLAAACVPDTDTAATAAATTLRRHTTRRRMADRTIQREERRPAISFFFSGATSATLNILFSTLIVLKTDSHTWFWRRTWEGAARERHGDWVLYRRWEWDGWATGVLAGLFLEDSPREGFGFGAAFCPFLFLSSVLIPWLAQPSGFCVSCTYFQSRTARVE